MQQELRNLIIRAFNVINDNSNMFFEYDPGEALRELYFESYYKTWWSVPEIMQQADSCGTRVTE